MLLAAFALPVFACAQSTDDRDVSWKLLLPNLLHDQARIWTLPVRLAEGQDWVNTAAFLGGGAAFAAWDPAEARWFRDSTSFHGFNRVFSSNATAIGTVAAPVALYLAGLATKDVKAQRTALLAGEAVANAEILSEALKTVTKRARPASFPAGSKLSDSWFEGSRTGGSFPSGHTIAAFSLATIIARRYGNHRWVPWVSYGAAAAVGFSRLSLSAHYASDVFAGAFLGYAVSRYAVLR